jgi:hypothetical protein
MMQLENLSVRQVSTGPAGAQVQAVVHFDILGILPDKVQIYAVNAAGAGLGALIDTVDINTPESVYDESISLAAGFYYTVHACPRTETNGVLDEKIDDVDWPDYCAAYVIITQATSSGDGKPAPPTISNLDPEPATLQQQNRIAVTWSSSTPCFKVQIGWTENGIEMQQHESNLGDPGQRSGTWVAPTSPKAVYTFHANGGSGLGGDTWSGWGPTVRITASPNSTSLSEFLRNSGIDPSGRHIKTLVAAGSTLRAFMLL